MKSTSARWSNGRRTDTHQQLVNILSNYTWQLLCRTFRLQRKYHHEVQLSQRIVPKEALGRRRDEAKETNGQWMGSSGKTLHQRFTPAIATPSGSLFCLTARHQRRSTFGRGQICFATIRAIIVTSRKTDRSRFMSSSSFGYSHRESPRRILNKRLSNG